MQKKRKAQVTIFIILAIAIVAGILIFFFAKQQTAKKQEISPEIQPIYSFVEECIRQTGTEVIYLISEQGGYYFSLSSEIPYYYMDGKSYIPTKEQIGNEIANGIDFELPFCTNNFTNFPAYQIKESEIKTYTKILDDKIVINVNYPLTITKGEKTTQLSKFEEIEIPIRLGIVYNAINEITQNQLTNQKYSINGKIKEAYCSSCISEIATANDVLVNMITEDYDPQTMIFQIIDENSKINNETFLFQFANKYQIE